MLNKRELNIIKKANEELQAVQAGCSARLLNKSDIEETISEAKRAFNRLGPIERKWIKKVVAVNEYSVPVAYNWPAKTSYIEVRLNHYGTLTDIFVDRISADKKAYGGSASIKIKYEYE